LENIYLGNSGNRNFVSSGRGKGDGIISCDGAGYGAVYSGITHPLPINAITLYPVPVVGIVIWLLPLMPRLSVFKVVMNVWPKDADEQTINIKKDVRKFIL
jgi:hypothetical protein